MRRSAICILLTVLAGVFVQPAAAKPDSSKAKARSAIEEAITFHNFTVVNVKTFAKQGMQVYRDCLEIKTSPEPHWDGIEATGRAIQQVERKDLKPYNKRLDGWAETLSEYNPSGKAAKSLKAHTVSELNRAHDLHAKEFFEFGASGTSIESHDCEGALAHLKKAAALGDAASKSDPNAWGWDGLGLRDAANLLDIGKKVAEEVQPYKHGGV